MPETSTIKKSEKFLAPRTYLAIDLKSFYASSECADRHLNPLTTNLVVADEERTDKTICLAVSPSLKAYGISGRARLFEVKQRIKEVNAERQRNAPGHSLTAECFDAEGLAQDPNLKLTFLTAPPRMARYMEVSAQIYSVYLKYVSPEDIVSYSIDEVFIDATPYLHTYSMTARELAMCMIREVLYTTGITATCGIGTNLYLAKVAMDIVAKHVPADKDGVRIAELDELSYRKKLWCHTPLTDFWRIGNGTAARLAKRGIKTMGDLAQVSTYDAEWFYKEFGVDAEILIEHAWGIEPVTIEHIKAYKPTTNSISEGQVLSQPYPYEKAKIIVMEMAESLTLQLAGHQLVTDSITLDISYDRENVDNGTFGGQIHIDHYGRSVPKPSHGSIKLDCPTNLGSKLKKATLELFDRISDKNLSVRKINITANRVVKDTGAIQIDLFTDTDKMEREKRLQNTVLYLQSRFGKNAVLRGTSLLNGATMRERNGQIGGHRA